MPHENKKVLARNGYLVQTKKLGLERTMNGSGQPFRKKSEKANFLTLL